MIGDQGYRVACDVPSPRHANPSGYFAAPFMTSDERERKLNLEVARLRRNAGIAPPAPPPPPASSALGEVAHQDRAWHGTGLHSLGDVSGQDRAWRSTGLQDLGDVPGQDRAWRSTGLQVHGDAYAQDREVGQLHGDVPLQDRAPSSAESNLRGRPALLHDSAQGECERSRRCRSSSKGDRESTEDADLKAIPIVLPQLPEPEGRDASLEAGDWITQLEPLIGDLSKNASQWWKKVMKVTSQRYAGWLHADPLVRLKIGAPEGSLSPQSFERLDQRVTSLLLRAVPSCVKDEVVATRELTTVGILYRIFKTYQPGGLGERSRLLEDLTKIPVAKLLKKWSRLFAHGRKGILCRGTICSTTRPTFDDPHPG